MASSGEKRRNSRRKSPLDPQRTRWQRIAALAARQHGVVTAAQLTATGLSARSVRDRSTNGHLHRIHRGVYSLGYPALDQRAHWMAAVLACGQQAVISHLSALALYELRAGSRKWIDVTLSSSSRRRHPGIRIHRPSSLLPVDRTTVDRIPATALPRTLLDVAGDLGTARLRQVIGEARRAHALTPGSLRDLLDRSAGHRGVVILRAASFDFLGGHGLTRSELEDRFLHICRRAGLPRPIVNGRIRLGNRRLEVDFHWPAHGLVVETDGYRFHSDPHAHTEDRRRDQELKLAGWEVLRFSWSQVAGDQQRVGRIVSSLLGASGEKRRNSRRKSPLRDERARFGRV